MSALRNRQILKQARFSKITCFTHEASAPGLHYGCGYVGAPDDSRLLREKRT